MASLTFEYILPVSLKIDRKTLRETLAGIRDQLLTHEINGGDRKLDMRTVCNKNRCGTAACIGGWASMFLLGFEVGKGGENGPIVVRLFDTLMEIGGDRLHDLFYSYECTKNFNQPNVAATAIQRYLDGYKEPWPRGQMPDVLRYKRARKSTKK